MEWVIIGPSGSGKSTLVKYILDQIQIISNKFIIILDDSFEYDDAVSNPKRISISKERLIKPNESVFDYFTNERLGEDRLYSLFLRSARRGEQVLFDLNALQTADAVKFIDTLSSTLLHKMKNTLLVLDEAYRLTPRNKGSKVLLQLLRSGRKRHISEIIIFQQFTDTDATTIRQSDFAVAFKPQGVSEIQNCVNTFNIKPDQINKMKPYDYIFKNMRTSLLTIEHLDLY